MNGYYFIKYRGQWMIGECDVQERWTTFEYSYLLSSDELDEIGERIKLPNEK